MRHGCWVPSEAGSRVDLFDSVSMLVGDNQDIQVQLSAVLARARLLVCGWKLCG